jgi:hypothetical protein
MVRAKKRIYDLGYAALVALLSFTEVSNGAPVIYNTEASYLAALGALGYLPGHMPFTHSPTALLPTARRKSHVMSGMFFQSTATRMME